MKQQWSSGTSCAHATCWEERSVLLQVPNPTPGALLPGLIVPALCVCVCVCVCGGGGGGGGFMHGKVLAYSLINIICTSWRVPTKSLIIPPSPQIMLCFTKMFTSFYAGQHAKGTAVCEFILLNKTTSMSRAQFIWFAGKEEFTYPM